jgi:hypothetical protein
VAFGAPAFPEQWNAAEPYASASPRKYFGTKRLALALFMQSRKTVDPMNIHNRLSRRPEQFTRSFMSPVYLMTDEQSKLLQILSAEAKLPYDATLTQLAAHERIIAIQDYLGSRHDV